MLLSIIGSIMRTNVRMPIVTCLLPFSNNMNSVYNSGEVKKTRSGR